MPETFDLQMFARQLASELGEWSIKPPSETYDAQTHTAIYRTDDPTFSLWLSTTWGPRNMLHISARFESYRGSNGLRYNEKAPRMNISKEKTPRQAAKEITRRLLPTYTEMHARNMAGIANMQRYAEAREQTEASIKAAERAYDQAHKTMAKSIYLRTEADGETTVKLSLSSVPLDLAKHIISMLP